MGKKEEKISLTHKANEKGELRLKIIIFSYKCVSIVNNGIMEYPIDVADVGMRMAGITPYLLVRWRTIVTFFLATIPSKCPLNFLLIFSGCCQLRLYNMDQHNGQTILNTGTPSSSKPLSVTVPTHAINLPPSPREPSAPFPHPGPVT